MTALPAWVLMETTNWRTAQIPTNRKWLLYREARDTKQGLYLFTDGSSSGAHAAILVRDGVCSTYRVQHYPMTATRNVGAEMNALLLGLTLLPTGAVATVVSDYRGVGAWCVGAWQAKKSEVQDQLRTALAQIQERQLILSFVHHAGHQKDATDFSKWNGQADQMCQEEERHANAAF